jgi:sugar (pentulose or hexulose) kinase
MGIQELRLAGGGSVPKPWRQVLADVLQRPLYAVSEPDASSRGAALLAGIATGVYGDVKNTLSIAPAVELVAAPGEQAAEYDAAYRRYVEGYPHLRGWPPG